MYNSSYPVFVRMCMVLLQCITAHTLAVFVRKCVELLQCITAHTLAVLVRKCVELLQCITAHTLAVLVRKCVELLQCITAHILVFVSTDIELLAHPPSRGPRGRVNRGGGRGGGEEEMRFLWWSGVLAFLIEQAPHPPPSTLQFLLGMKEKAYFLCGKK